LKYFINYSPENFTVVVRSEKEKRYFHQKSNRNIQFVIWSICEPPPLALQNNDSIVIVTDLYPIDESIQWWLAKLSRPFIAVVHKDLDNRVPSYLGEINLYTGANYSVQIVQNKLKNKNNMKVEHYYEERNQFYSKEIGLEEVRENEKEDVLDFGVSFSTTLTAEEERVRKIVNETELPYLKRRTKDNVEHKIEIDSEDEDDPDDDLDI